jgi:hypothetical protein
MKKAILMFGFLTLLWHGTKQVGKGVGKVGKPVAHVAKKVIV